MNRVIPDSVTLLAMKAIDTSREITIVLDNVGHFEIITKLRAIYKEVYKEEAPYDYDTQTITMNLKELHLWEIIQVVQEYSGRIVEPDEFPTEEEESEYLYEMITNPPKYNLGDPDSDEPPF